MSEKNCINARDGKHKWVEPIGKNKRHADAGIRVCEYCHRVEKLEAKAVLESDESCEHPKCAEIDCICGKPISEEQYNGIKASDLQVGGSHYRDCTIQPSEFIYKNRLSWLEGNAIKYICRHHLKGGDADIDKAIHYLELLKEWEYGTTKDTT